MPGDGRRLERADVDRQDAVALALVERGRVVVGVLGCPNLPPPANAESDAKGFLFSAIAGSGASVRRIGWDEIVSIRVGHVTDPSQAIFCESVEAAHAAHSVQAGIAAAIGKSYKYLKNRE